MEFSINALTKMSGVSARTLRYYDQIGLLKPVRVASSGYRIYGRPQVDRLQQILLYRELGFSLDDIDKLLSAPDFDRERAFAGHLAELHKKRARLDRLIANVSKSIAAMKGSVTMSESEKFEGFKHALIAENERNYGAEIREKYGDQAVEQSNAKLMGMTQAEYKESERLCAELELALKAAMETGDPASPPAQQACDLHRQWLCLFYPNYSREYHRGLGELYVSDPRFTAYYDKLASGCAAFLRDAINVYCRE